MKGAVILAISLGVVGCGGGGSGSGLSSTVGSNQPPVILWSTDYYSGTQEIGLGSIYRSNRLTFGGGNTIAVHCGNKIVYLASGEVRSVDSWPPFGENDQAIPNIPPGVSTISGPTLVFCKDGIFKIGLDGTGKVQLRPSGTFGQITPDGTKLAYLDSGHVFVSDASGANPVQISSMTADWLTVNDTIAVFHSGSALYVLPLSGGAPQFLAATDNFQGACFDDTNSVLFGSKPPEFDDHGNPIEIPTDFGDIWKVSLSTHVVTKYLDLGKNDGYPSFVGTYAALGGH